MYIQTKTVLFIIQWTVIH